MRLGLVEVVFNGSAECCVLAERRLGCMCLLCDPSHLLCVASPIADWRLTVQVMWLHTHTHIIRNINTRLKKIINYLTMTGGTLVGLKSETIK